MKRLKREGASLAQVTAALILSTDLEDDTENVMALLEAGIRPARVEAEVYEAARVEARRIQALSRAGT